MRIDRIDHFVITARDVGKTAEFYSRVLGMEVVSFAGGRTALTFGRQKINLHQAGEEVVPHARTPQVGGADFCLIADGKIEEIAAHIEACGVEIEIAPSPRTGATGPITSVYFRDPDGNLVEVSTYD
jgi:catechol 2,3-dioxygenase-like lactoylglutathione lyase family enzyme